MQGNANINQRSLAGSRDTELAVVLHQVQDKEENNCVLLRVCSHLVLSYGVGVVLVMFVIKICCSPFIDQLDQLDQLNISPSTPC